nr:MAG TPA: hypothetical protein [Caudoviricetes sp.]
MPAYFRFFVPLLFRISKIRKFTDKEKSLQI